MLSRAAKAGFYLFAGPLMKINGMAYRLLRAPSKGTVRLHLGPGQSNYIPGWINVDANMFTAKCDLWADLRNPLPFSDGTVDAIYSHHVVEHLPDIWSHFREANRCLKPGGAYRVGVPNGDGAIEKFVANEKSWFGDFPDKRNSIGGRFENFVFCRQEHLSILTFSYLEEIILGAGFSSLTACLPVKETNHAQLFLDCLQMESESDFSCPHTLVVEAVK